VVQRRAAHRIDPHPDQATEQQIAGEAGPTLAGDLRSNGNHGMLETIAPERCLERLVALYRDHAWRRAAMTE
jgi:hypothetical protein